MTSGKSLRRAALSALILCLAVSCSSSNSSSSVDSITTTSQDLTLDPDGETTVITFGSDLPAGVVAANFATDGAHMALTVAVVGKVATVTWDARVSPSDQVKAVGISGVSETFSSVTSTDMAAPTFTVAGSQTVGALGSDDLTVTFSGARVVEAEAEDPTNWELRVNGTAMDLTGAVMTLNTATQVMTVDLPATANLHATFTFAATSLNSVADVSLASAPVAGAATGDLVVPTLVGGTAVQNLAMSEYGLIVDFTFSEAVDPVFATQIANFSPAFPIFASSVTQPSDTVLRVGFTGPIIPGVNTITVTGVLDAHGNAFAGGSIAVTAGSTVANGYASTPTLSTVANEGGDNLVATFVQAFEPLSAENPANWSLVVDAVTIDLSTQNLTYDFNAKTLTIDLTADHDNGDSFTLMPAAGNAALDVDGQDFASMVTSAVSGEMVLPTVVSVTQNRSVDTTGKTLDVALSEDVDATAAQVPGNWAVTGGITVNTATLLSSKEVVRLVLDAAAIPGDVTVTASAVQDLAGNTMAVASGLAIVTTDGTAPIPSAAAASAIEGSDNDTLTVSFSDDMIASEVMTAANWTVQTPIGTDITEANTTIAYNAGSRTATMTFGASSGVNLRTGDDFNLTFTGLRDLGGNTISGTVLSGDVSAESRLPLLESVFQDTGFTNQVHVRFSEPMDMLDDIFDATTNPTGLTVYTLRDSGGSLRGTPQSVTPHADDLGATLTFGFLVALTDTLDVSGVIDLAGNSLFSVSMAAVIAEEAGTPTLDAGNSDFLVTSGEQNDSIVVAFDRPMSSWEILDPSKYVFKLGMTTIDLAHSEFSFDGDRTLTIDLNTPSAPDLATASSYDMTVSGLSSRQGVSISGTTAGTLNADGASDATNPMLVANSVIIDAANEATAVLIRMDEALDPTDAVDTSIITLNGVNPSAAVRVGGRTVRATFASVAAGQMLSTTMADLAGNAGVASVAVVAKDTTGPLLASVAGITRSGLGLDEITVTFTEAVNPATALLTSNYTVTQSGSSVDISGSTMRLDSNNNRVHIELPASVDLVSALGVTVVTSGVTDVSGNAMSPAVNLSGVCTGDTTAPAFAESFVNLRANASSLMVDIRFSEDVDPVFAANAANYSSDGGQAVSAATLLRPDVVRLTLSAPMLSGEKIELNGLLDPAGNASAAIDTIPVP